MSRLFLVTVLAVVPVAGQLQTKVFDRSGQASIGDVRVDRSNGEIVIGGRATGPGLPLVNAFQPRFASSGMRRTSDGARTWEAAQRPVPERFKLVADPLDRNTVYALASSGLYQS